MTILKNLADKIDINVKVDYSFEHSNPTMDQYYFIYEITLLNTSRQTVQLLSRDWWIKDCSGFKKNVSGEGVVGKQPYLLPGKPFTYKSWCPIQAKLGKMSGAYTLLNVDTKEEFLVDIPAFVLADPAINN